MLTKKTFLLMLLIGILLFSFGLWLLSPTQSYIYVLRIVIGMILTGYGTYMIIFALTRG